VDVDKSDDATAVGGAAGADKTRSPPMVLREGGNAEVDAQTEASAPFATSEAAFSTAVRVRKCRCGEAIRNADDTEEDDADSSIMALTGDAKANEVSDGEHEMRAARGMSGDASVAAGADNEVALDEEEEEEAEEEEVEDEDDSCWLRPAAELVRRIGAHGDVKVDAVTVRGIGC
jgi:hypothetical protein